MIENWREWLYPFGYIAQFAFAGRFLQQWLTSEIHQKSMVTKGFWRLSIIGNVMMMIHSIIQAQFHVTVIQACNTIISWRNLNLMQDKSKQYQLSSVIFMMLASIFSVAVLFILMGFLFGDIEWFRVPTLDGKSTHSVGGIWHIIGFIGLILFSSRFWVQWLDAERKHASHLGLAFWWLSLIGSVLMLVYFVRIDDPVNVWGPAVGLIPYIRNLMLIQKNSKATPGIHE